MKVIEYVTEEVQRQGHDVTQQDGIARVGWMLNAWEATLSMREAKPTISQAIRIGKQIEPFKNSGGLRTCHVRVGLNRCPNPELLEGLLFNLFGALDRLTPIEFYKQFEEIHPFVDGNGRTGKILLNWLNGTLLDPIFPPNDLFGRPIRNP